MTRNSGEQSDLRPMAPLSVQPGSGHMGLSDIAMAQINQAGARAFAISWRSFAFPDPDDAPQNTTTAIDTDTSFQMNGDNYAIPWFVSPASSGFSVSYIVAGPPVTTTRLEVRFTIQTCITSISSVSSSRNYLSNGTLPPRGLWRRVDEEQIRLYSGRITLRPGEFTIPADRIVCIAPKFRFATISGTNPSTVSTNRWCKLHSMLVRDTPTPFSGF